jgi:hypothetical protein
MSENILHQASANQNPRITKLLTWRLRNWHLETLAERQFLATEHSLQWTSFLFVRLGCSFRTILLVAQLTVYVWMNKPAKRSPRSEMSQRRSNPMNLRFGRCSHVSKAEKGKQVNKSSGSIQFPSVAMPRCPGTFLVPDAVSISRKIDCEPRRPDWIFMYVRFHHTRSTPLCFLTEGYP